MFRNRKNLNDDVRQVRNLYGCTYGFCYMIVFVLTVSMITGFLLIPIFAEPGNENVLAYYIGSASYYLMIPVGIYGFLRHRKR